MHIKNMQDQYNELIHHQSDEQEKHFNSIHQLTHQVPITVHVTDYQLTLGASADKLSMGDPTTG